MYIIYTHTKKNMLKAMNFEYINPKKYVFSFKAIMGMMGDSHVLLSIFEVDIGDETRVHICTLHPFFLWIVKIFFMLPIFRSVEYYRC